MARNGLEISSALLVAQQNLLRLRQTFSDGCTPRSESALNITSPSAASSAGQSIERLPHPGQLLPDHLGWESAPLTAAMRGRRRSLQLCLGRTDSQGQLPTGGKHPKPEHPSDHSGNSRIKLYPDLALGMLRCEKTASGRVWLLLRHLDTRGRGWVSLSESRSWLTSSESELRVCGWRQLRNLLAQGEGIFWQRTRDRIWLRSVAKVGASLGVRQLTGHPVAISPAVLTRRIGTVRAHFYASFHSGRSTETGDGRRRAMPIARKTLKHLCRVSRRTQRNYEKRAGVRRQRNFAVGDPVTLATEHEAAWHHGRALFRLYDKKGRHGPAGRAYFAWQLPNNYIGPHEARSRGRQKRINKEIADLFMKGMTGNDKDLDAAGWPKRSRRFFHDGRQAVKACSRPVGHDRYWHGLQEAHPGQTRTWNCLQADVGFLRSKG